MPNGNKIAGIAQTKMPVNVGYLTKPHRVMWAGASEELLNSKQGKFRKSENKFQSHKPLNYTARTLSATTYFD